MLYGLIKQIKSLFKQAVILSKITPNLFLFLNHKRFDKFLSRYDNNMLA